MRSFTPPKKDKDSDEQIGRKWGGLPSISLIFPTREPLPSQGVLTFPRRPPWQSAKGRIGAKLDSRQALKINEKLESRIILEEPGAETLLGRGDLLFKDLGPAIRLQAPFISDEDLKKLFGDKIFSL